MLRGATWLILLKAGFERLGRMTKEQQEEAKRQLLKAIGLLDLGANKMAQIVLEDRVLPLLMKES